MSPPASFVRFRRPISTFTISIGRLTTKCSSQPRPRGRATTIGGSRESTRSTGPENFHAFANFPDFALAKDGKFVGVVRSSYEAPPEVWAGPIGGWRQITKNNAVISPAWGKAESV